MVRTQIQLTEEQAAKLKRLAAARNRSMADLIRQGVDALLEGAAGRGRGDRMRHAAKVFGRFRSGAGDLADKHDEHFAAAVRRR